MKKHRMDWTSGKLRALLALVAALCVLVAFAGAAGESGDGQSEPPDKEARLIFTVNGFGSGAGFDTDVSEIVFEWKCADKALGWNLYLRNSASSLSLSESFRADETSFVLDAAELGQDFFTATLDASLESGERLSATLGFSILAQHEEIYVRADASYNIVAYIDAQGRVGLEKGTPLEVIELEVFTNPEWKDWTNIVQVAAGSGHLVALDDEGTVHAAGENLNGQTNCAGLEHVRYVCAGDINTACVMDSGKLRLFGSFSDAYAPLAALENVSMIDISNVCVAVLFKDGTAGIIDIFPDAEDFAGEVGTWTDIIKLSLSNGYVMGLKRDGTVLYAGNPSSVLAGCAEWTDIADIAAGNGYALGVKTDGSVVSLKKARLDFIKTEDWQNIVAVSAGYYVAAGVTADGELVLSDM